MNRTYTMLAAIFVVMLTTGMLVLHFADGPSTPKPVHVTQYQNSPNWGYGDDHSIDWPSTTK